MGWDQSDHWKRWYRRMGAGHPIHAILVHVPMACLPLAWAVRIFRLIWPNLVEPGVREAFLVVGLLFSVPAAITGLIELWVLVLDEARETTAMWHLGLMGTAVTCFFAGWLIETAGSQFGHGLIVGLETTGFILLTVGGWFGGELVFDDSVQSNQSRRETHTDDI